jgi:hypothetical protein
MKRAITLTKIYQPLLEDNFVKQLTRLHMGSSEQEEIHYAETNSTYKFSITGKNVRVFII